MANDSTRVEREVGRFAKNAAAEVIGRLTVISGIECIDIRIFIPTTGGQMRATKKGVCIVREKASDLLKLATDLAEACKPDDEETE